MSIKDGQWGVIINPYSGNKRLVKDRAKICQILKSADIRFDERITAYAGHAILIAREMVENGIRHILIVGGDGTLNETVNGIFTSNIEDKSSVSLALIPYGTGNDWARYWNLLNTRKKLSSELFHRNKVKVDIGVLRYEHEGKEHNQYFINGAGFGFDAHVVSKANRLKRLFGRHSWLYSLALLLSVFTYKSNRMRLVTESGEMENNIFSIAVGNGCYSGGGIKQAPDANPTDGVFHITAIERLTFVKIVLGLKALAKGEIDKHPCAHVFVSKTLTLSSQKALEAETDGVVVPLISKSTIQVIPQALGMYV